jgi:hypothetical protein
MGKSDRRHAHVLIQTLVRVVFSSRSIVATTKATREPSVDSLGEATVERS